MLKRIPISPLLMMLVFSSAPAAQGLADVARAEEARRKATKAPSKIYTNESLRGLNGGDPPPMPAAPASVTSDGTKSTAPAAARPEPSADDIKDEKYWRDRITRTRTELKRSQMFLDALHSQINGLYTEFVNMDDPARRSVIEQKRLGAIAEQDRLKTEIVRLTKAVADIEEEARRASVPAGWLR